MTPASAVPGTSSFDLGLIPLAFAPVFLLTIGVEAWYWHKRDPSVYNLRDTVSNACLASTHQASDVSFLWLIIKAVYSWMYSHDLHAAPETWWSFVLLLLLQDFLYYFFHRVSHRVHWMQASHVTHYPSEDTNFSTAFRQSLTYPVPGMWLFWISPTWIDFTPDWIVLVASLNLTFQLFVHTRLETLDSHYVGFWCWLGQYVNTPSVHRIHHVKNPQYIDHNYADVLAIWDRMFGSFVPGEDAPVFDIARQAHTHNLTALTFYEWYNMWVDMLRDWDIRYLWKPSEWCSPRAAVMTEAMPLT